MLICIKEWLAMVKRMTKIPCLLIYWDLSFSEHKIQETGFSFSCKENANEEKGTFFIGSPPLATL